MLFKAFPPPLADWTLATVPWGENVYCPHFRVKATEDHRELVTSLQSHS